MTERSDKNPPRPYIINENNWKSVKETDYSIAILPWGATEAHNYHLPYGTDNIQCDYIAAEAAKKAWKENVKVAVLPTVPYGVNTQQLDIKLTINMNPSTQAFVLRDVVDSLNGQGIKKLIVLNGHGGNDFRQMIREIKADYPGFFIGTINWYLVEGDWKKYFEDTGDHAGEMETSIMMHIAPDWVLSLKEAGDGASKKLKFHGRHEGWLWAPREWTKVSRDTGIGNPSRSSEEKGKNYLGKIIPKISEFLIELDKTDPENIYVD
ncbi:MAG: creatininase family protein [Cyclobacteriaceae bacterium]|jgi:creatinine amidohydrolase